MDNVMPTRKKCSTCKESKPLSEFYRLKRSADGRGYRCKACVLIVQRKHRASGARYANMNKDPLKYMFSVKKGQAKAAGMAWDLTLEQVREMWEATGGRCAYLGIEMKLAEFGGNKKKGLSRGARDPNRVNFDRIDSSRGYTLGNVQLISDLANRMKQDATPEQLRTFARSILRLHG